MQEWTSQNGKAFIVEFTAEKDKFAHYLPLAKDIINSIEINGIGSTSATPSSTANQSASSSPTALDNATISNNETAMTANKTQVSSAIIEKLLKRDIDTNETNAGPLSNDTINAEK